MKRQKHPEAERPGLPTSNFLKKYIKVMKKKSKPHILNQVFYLHLAGCFFFFPPYPQSLVPKLNGTTCTF